MIMHQRPKKPTVFTSTFFNFLLGFIVILSISLAVVFATGYYAQMIKTTTESAAAIFSQIILW